MHYTKAWWPLCWHHTWKRRDDGDKGSATFRKLLSWWCCTPISTLHTQQHSTAPREPGIVTDPKPRKQKLRMNFKINQNRVCIGRERNFIGHLVCPPTQFPVNLPNSWPSRLFLHLHPWRAHTPLPEATRSSFKLFSLYKKKKKKSLLLR